MHLMNNRQKEKWLTLYDRALEIAHFKPWAVFDEDQQFLFVRKQRRESVFYSFLGPSACRACIACYEGERNYVRAMERLHSGNGKQEPTFFLQNGFMGIWGNRNDLDKDTCALLKELGIHCRGNGSWLHFLRFEEGYAPVLPNDKELDRLIDLYENLIMLLRGFFEGELGKLHTEGDALVRIYDEKEKMYFSVSEKIKNPKSAGDDPVFTFSPNERSERLRTTETGNIVLEIGWSYLNTAVTDNDGRDAFPLLLLMADTNTGIVLETELITPSVHKENVLIDKLEKVIAAYGKPKEIRYRENDIAGILNDFCRIIDVKRTLRKTLPAIDRAKKEMMSNMGLL